MESENITAQAEEWFGSLSSMEHNIVEDLLP